MKHPVPARSAVWLLGLLAPERAKDGLVGDLIEEHALRSRSQSRARVALWYWGQLLRSIAPLVRARARQGRWLSIAAAALTAYLLETIVESAGEIAVSTLVAPGPSVRALLGLLIGLPSMILGGYVAARLQRGAATALAVMIAIVVLALMATMGDTVPLWYQLGFLVGGPAASLAGGALTGRESVQ